MIRNILTQFSKKIKENLALNQVELGVSAIIIFVGLSSFFLGKYSVLDSQSSESCVSIESPRNATSSEVRTEASTQKETLVRPADNQGSDGQVVASKNGKKYYFPWCSGVDRISAKNKVYFKSATEAQNAGLTISATCKGLD